MSAHVAPKQKPARSIAGAARPGDSTRRFILTSQLDSKAILRHSASPAKIRLHQRMLAAVKQRRLRAPIRPEAAGGTGPPSLSVEDANWRQEFFSSRPASSS